MNFCGNENLEYTEIHKKSIGNILIKPLLLLLLIIGVFAVMSNGAYAMSLTAVPAAPDTDTQVRLDWSSVPNAQAYRLWRRSGSGPDTMVATIDVLSTLDSLSYKDTGLDADTLYIYTIRAFSDTGCTVLLEEAAVPVTTTPMITPYNVRATFNINTREVTLTWDVSKYADSCVITRYAEDGSFTEFAADSTTSTTIYESGMDVLRYCVTSKRGSMVSGKSNIVTVKPIAVPVLQAVFSGGGITVSSNMPVNDATKFRLARSKWDGSSWGGWTTVCEYFENAIYTDHVTAGGQYRYRLEAHSGYTGYSNVTDYVSIQSAPVGLTANILSPNEIELSWTNAPGSSGNIKIMRKIGSGAFTQIASLPADAQSYIDSINVVPGTVYSYMVYAYVSSDNHSAGVTVSVSASLPAAPTSLRADLSSTAGITLTWTDNADNEDGFIIERMTSPGTYVQLNPNPPIGPGTGTGGTVTYLDEDVTPGNTYIYRVRSYNVLGSSAYSNEVTVSSWDTVAPASLTVTPVSSTRLDLTWSYSGTLTYNTVIERKTGTTGTWTTIYTAPRGVLKYSDTGLSPNTQYFYRIRKSLGPNATGVPYPNNEIGIGAYTLLGNLTLNGDAVSGNSIRLSWTGNTYADIIIERKMSNGNFSVLTIVSAYTNSWTDSTGLVPGASYTYRIKSQTATNESLYSNECTVRNFYLDAPTSLEATVDTEGTITLEWTDESRDETGFEIWRRVYGASEYTLYATVGQNVTTYTDTKVTKGIQYYYRVRAYIAADSYYSSFSNTATTGVGLIKPPSDLSYEYVSTNKVTLKWKDNSSDENGFQIERKIGAEGEWKVLYWVARNSTSYTIGDLDPNIDYYFRVRAYTYSGNASAVSEEILVSTALPIAPSDVTAQAVSASQVKITWQDNSDNEKGFRILRRPSTSSTFTELATVGSNITVYFDNAVVYGKQYYYKVASYNDTGSSESPVATVKTTSAKSSFTDLGSVPWAKDAIESLAGLGIIKGVSETSFAPGKTISKAEFTAIVVRAFGLETAPIGSLADVKSDKWYYKSVMIAENLGVISGDGNNRFYPEAAITREEICMMLFRALQVTEKKFTIHDNSALEKFIDKNNISPESLAGMATLAGEGIIEGLPGNIIGPKYTATRAQAAVFVYRTLSKIRD